jgi:hypothetical protein
VRRGNATTSQTGGPREVEQEAMAQREEGPCNSNERWRRRQMGGGGVRRGNASTSQTRDTRGNDATRGDSTMRGELSGRWEAAA